MSADRDALLAAIRANPDDDTPRLVFADWLDDHGEPAFAAFIRLEIERDRFTFYTPEWRALEERVRALGRRAFPGHVEGILSPTRRGFHHHIRTDVLSLAAGIDRLGPYSTALVVQMGAATQQDQDAEREFAAGGPDLVGAALRRTFASPWVRERVTLQTYSLRLTPERAESMTGPGTLTGLSMLALDGGADDDAIRVLATAELPRLTQLAVVEVAPMRDEPLLTPAAIDAVLESRLAPRLELQRLWGGWLGGGLRAVIESPNLGNLRLLDVQFANLDAALIDALAAPGALPRLERLVVTGLPDDYQTRLADRLADGLVVGPPDEEE